MMSTGVLLVFRLAHILSGVFWVGSILFFSRFIFPTARALGPAAGPVIDHLNRVLKVPMALIGCGVLTILSGFGLFWNDSMGFKGAWMSSHTGMTFSLGALSAIIAFVIGLAVNAPTAKKMVAVAAQVHAKGGPPTPEQAAEMQRLQRRLGGALQAVTVLLLLTTAAMALARYIP
jgi:uncharacterized membrane protein